MELAFDLISDLHIETWNDFDWSGQATSPYCVVAGDISRDHQLVEKTLKHLGENYQGVFYIDGNDEHRNYLTEISDSYRSLNRRIRSLKNVVFMQDNLVVINGVAFLGTNGWWSYDFDPMLDDQQCRDWYCEHRHVPRATCDVVCTLAFNDSAYLINSVKRLQTHQDVKRIVVVSHTVPTPELVTHDLDLVNTPRFNVTGNRHMQLCLAEDTENKISTWCFGHYHRPVDRVINGVHYVNNCRGAGNTPWSQPAYYPRRIVIEV